MIEKFQTPNSKFQGSSRGCHSKFWNLEFIFFWNLRALAPSKMTSCQVAAPWHIV